MARLKSIGWQDLLDLIDKAEFDLVLVSPAIHEELTDAMISLSANKGVQLWICTDNNEDSIRSGYGDIHSITRLEDNGAIIREKAGLKITYLGIDGVGYLLFLESRILSNGPGGINTIVLDEIDSRYIEQAFFEQRYPELQDQIDTISENLDTDQLQNTMDRLKEKPPVLPDLRREISVYNNHFQFVELTLEGGSINSTVVAIPASALPFRDREIRDRMNTRYKLFDKEDEKVWEGLSKINSKVAEIREAFLIPCTVRKGKSILKNAQKVEFENQLGELQKIITKASKELEAKVQDAIDQAFASLQKELEDFLFRYKLEFFTPMLSDEIYMNKVKMEVFRILQKVSIPKASSLVNKIKYTIHYYDLTWEDTKSDELIDWFRKKELISPEFEGELATIRNAYEVER